jgi:exoribonuclease-2
LRDARSAAIYSRGVANQEYDLARIAEDAMRERGFIPHPPDAARSEADQARAATDGLTDLRALPWTSIDNIESQDLDQIEVAEAQTGGTRLWVGIADVGAFVEPAGPIDRFAGNNTTSVYTGVRTFPMLPERLSFDRTSLLADESARPAMVIESFIKADGSIGDAPKVYPALVVNRAKLDYPSVSVWLDGGAAPAALANEPTLRAQIELQDRLAKSLADARRRDGALDVDTAELRAKVDAQGHVIGLEPHHQDRAGRVIEELMIASNRSVARVLDGAGVASIRRVVKEPERWAKIVEYAGQRGSKLPESPSSLALAQFIDRMRKERASEFTEISLALVKLMGRGEYVAHEPRAPEIGHFGLATAVYTHATAPNRRYPDLITQRLLRAVARGAGRPAYAVDQLAAIAERCTKMEAEAEKVQRRVHKSAAASLLASRVGEIFDAVVTGANERGTFARILAPAVDGKVVRGAGGLEVGARVRVKLTDVSVERGFIDLAVV